MSEDLLFADLKVLDVGSWIAAPVAATMLADYGADVTKIELPGLGDAYRNFSATPGAPDAEVNFAWQMDARNKRSLALNLKTTKGREILLSMVRDADVYVTNHSPSMREAWGLTYEALSAVNPKLIYASLTAYGEAGPERDREGFDLVAYWARSGLMDLVRAPGSNPAAALPGMGDHPTAVTMYAGITTALLRRYKTGKGSYVHTSLLANGMWSAGCIAQAAFTEGHFGRYRRMLGHLFTRVLYECKDGRWLQFSMVRTEAEIDQMFAVLGIPEILVDERFIDPAERLQNGDQLSQIMQEAMRARESAEWMSLFHAADVPSALVGQVEGLPDDVQVQVNKMTREPGNTGVQRLIKHPVNIDGLATATPEQAPDIGQHSAEVLTELGFSLDEIEQLRADGVI